MKRACLIAIALTLPAAPARVTASWYSATPRSTDPISAVGRARFERSRRNVPKVPLLRRCSSSSAASGLGWSSSRARIGSAASSSDIRTAYRTSAVTGL